MSWMTSEKVFSICGFLLVILVVLTESRKLDCTKFVFAPKCRGVAAKRSNEFGFPQFNRRSSLNTVPLLQDNWYSDEEDTLDFLKGLRLLIQKVNHQQRPSFYSTGDSSLLKKILESR